VLVALSDLASEMSSAAGPHGLYAAGLWRSELLMTLMWYPLGSVSRPNTFLAPSWSWASLRCESIGLTNTFYGNARDAKFPVLEALDMTVVPSNISSGPVLGGFIRVRGAPAKGKIYHEKRGNEGEIWCDPDMGGMLYGSIPSNNEDENQPVPMSEDQPEDEACSDELMYFLLVMRKCYADPYNRAGLLMTSTGVEKGQDRRAETGINTESTISTFVTVDWIPPCVRSQSSYLTTITIV
jgi:hypothetical protein